MSIDWYLMKTPHNQLSGFESEAFDEFAEEGFAELLETDVSIDVEIYNYDLSICTPLKAIVQNRVQDTKLKSLNRHIFVPIGTCKAGMYVKYKNRYWLIVGLVDDNGMYEKAIMTLCNYYLTWINAKGQIVQRWANVTSASQYNHGETDGKNYTLKTDQLLVSVPDDDESSLLPSGKRFIIDKRCKIYEKEFDENVTVNTSHSLIVYELTRIDNILFNYQDSGHSEFMVSQKEQSAKDGYYVINGKGYWLCESPALETDENIVLSSIIECDSNEIYDGLEAGIFTARFYDSDGKETNVSPEWEIRCDFLDKLDIEYVNNSVLISVDDEDLLNKSFELILNGDGYASVSQTITIRTFL